MRLHLLATCVVIAACGSPPPAAAPKTPEPAPKVGDAKAHDPCQRAIVSLAHDAPLPMTFTLFSAPGVEKAGPLDTWLRALASKASPNIVVRWFDLTDEAVRKRARWIGLADEANVGVSVSLAVDADVVALDNASPAAARAWIENATRTVVAHAQGRTRHVGFVGDADVAKQLARALPYHEIAAVDLTKGVPENTDVLVVAAPIGAAEPATIDDFSKRAPNNVVKVERPQTTAAFIALLNAIDAPVVDDDVRACTELLGSKDATVEASATRSSPEPWHPPETTALIGKDDATRITRLEIQNGSASVIVERDDTKWRVVAPASARGDANAENIATALAGLSEVRLREAIPGGGAVDSFLGLAGTGALRIVASAGSTHVVDVLVGRSGRLGNAIRSGTAPDARVGTDFSRWRFDGQPKRWRRTLMWQFERSDVKQIDLHNDRGRWLFDRAQTGWKASFKGRPAANITASRVDDMVNAFRHLDADDFAEADADTGLDKPSTLRFTLDGGRHVLLQLGKARKAGGLYARVEGDATIYVIPVYQSRWIDAPEEQLGLQHP